MSTNPAACENCATPLAGAFCHACGQKRLGAGDRRLAHLLGEALHKLTDVDGTLLRSLRLLIFRPGWLSREYMDGRRVRYSSPISLFLLANLLYFLSPAMSDFNLPFADQVPRQVARLAVDPAAPDAPQRLSRRQGEGGGQLHSPWTSPLVARKLAVRQASEPGYDMVRLARDYDREAGIVGKVLIIAHVPVIALALAAVYWQRRRYFAEHFVVALHAFTFLLLFAQGVLAPLDWLGTHFDVALPPPFGHVLAYALLAWVLAYLLFAARNAYRTGWLGAVPGFVALVLGLGIANIVFYRALQFVVTLALI
jgi:hypothetical protein